MRHKREFAKHWKNTFSIRNKRLRLLGRVFSKSVLLWERGRNRETNLQSKDIHIKIACQIANMKASPRPPFTVNLSEWALLERMTSLLATSLPTTLHATRTRHARKPRIGLCRQQMMATTMAFLPPPPLKRNLKFENDVLHAADSYVDSGRPAVGSVNASSSRFWVFVKATSELRIQFELCPRKERIFVTLSLSCYYNFWEEAAIEAKSHQNQIYKVSPSKH